MCTNSVEFLPVQTGVTDALLEAQVAAADGTVDIGLGSDTGGRCTLCLTIAEHRCLHRL